MAETHELRLKINAAPAKQGSREFVAAVNAVKRAVRDLEKDSTGAFTSLRRVDTAGLREVTREAQNAAKGVDSTARASDRAADTIRRTALASANALRVSTDQASRLRDRLLSVGDTAGLAKLETALARLKMNLTNATSGLDVREARAGYSDLASELNRTARDAERLRAIANSNAREMEEASRAAAAHGETLDRLRAKYNPLYSASKQYETALEEISFAEREGAISAQMAAQARARAAAQLNAASAAADQYSSAMQRSAAATMQGVGVSYQLQDVLIMAQGGFASVGQIALTQGSQIAGQLNMLRATGGGVFRTLLAGLTSLVNPLSLITIGAVAAGAMIAKWFFAAGEETKSFSDALSDANSRINELRSATDALAGNNLRQLRRQYGEVNAELDAHLERLRKVAELEAGISNSTMIASIRDALTSDGNMFTTDVDAVRRAFDTTNDRARIFLGLMRDVENARTFQAQAEAVTALRAAVESTTGGLERAEGGAKGVLTQLVRAEDAALRLLAAQSGVTGATDSASGAASNLTHTIGTAADEAARLLANLNSVPSALAVMGKSVSDQISSIRAQNAALNLQISEGLSAQAANRRVQLETMISTAGERGQRLNVDQIAAEWRAISELDAAAQEQARLRDRLSKMNRPARKARSGGGSSARTAALTEEQKAVESLTSSLKDRLTGLREERLALELVASGQFETSEGARAMAEAQLAMGGAVDATTEALIRQIDAAQKTANEMRRAANAGAQGWLNAVPSYQEAADQIEVEILDSLSNEIASFAKTGEFNFERLADSILATMADLAAQLAVKELFGGTLGGSGSSGGLLSGLFGSSGGFLAGLFSEGGYSTQAVAHSALPASAFSNAPHFAQGTANTSGIPAVLHDNEAVIPLTKGRKVPVEMGGTAGGQTLNYAPTYNIQTPDADSFRRSQKQVAADGFSAAQRAAANNR